MSQYACSFRSRQCSLHLVSTQVLSQVVNQMIVRLLSLRIFRVLHQEEFAHEWLAWKPVYGQFIMVINTWGKFELFFLRITTNTGWASALSIVTFPAELSAAWYIWSIISGLFHCFICLPTFFELVRNCIWRWSWFIIKLCAPLEYTFLLSSH